MPKTKEKMFTAPKDLKYVDQSCVIRLLDNFFFQNNPKSLDLDFWVYFGGINLRILTKYIPRLLYWQFGGNTQIPVLIL